MAPTALMTLANHAYSQVNESPHTPFRESNIELLSERYNGNNLEGEVMNNGTSVAKSVKVSASFYDVNGDIVATEYSYADPSTIKPGDKSPFKIYTSDEVIQLVAKSYELILQWLDAEGEENSKRVIAEESIDQQLEHSATTNDSGISNVTDILQPNQTTMTIKILERNFSLSPIN
jgi:hypothetical protein